MPVVTAATASAIANKPMPTPNNLSVASVRIHITTPTMPSPIAECASASGETIRTKSGDIVQSIVIPSKLAMPA